MQWLLDVLKQRTDENWLIGADSLKLQQLTTELYLELRQFSSNHNPPKIILTERNPVKFLAYFIAACASECHIFLCNPDWRQQEWQQVLDLVQPDIIWGQLDCEVKNKNKNQLPITNYPSPNSILIPTGGSSGKIKFAIHTWETLMASVRGFRDYFQLDQVNSFCVLPLYHVSGLMQFMRSFTSGGKLVITPFKQIESAIKWDIKLSSFFISLVPTQLQSLLENPQLTNWLSQFKTVLLGGAPPWQELLETAKYHHIRLAPTYGMTETASQIATLKPDDFLNGKVNSGRILPHAHVNIYNQEGELLNTNQIGNIAITAESLFLGYYNYSSLTPCNYQLPVFLTDDLGFLDSHGYLNIIGRNSNKIITGGENVYPEEVESAIKATKMVTDVCVIGIQDEQWGQAVTAIYIPQNSHISISKIQNLLREKISKFKIPKHWIPVSTLQRNSQGKINRQYLETIAKKYIYKIT